MSQDVPHTGSEDSAGQSVIKALRALIESTGKPPTDPATVSKREPRHWLRMLILVLAAVDASAILWALESLTHHPFFELLLKAIPAVFGVTIAANVEAVGRIVRGIADRTWFRLTVVVGLLVFVIPQFWTYALPVSIPLGAHVYLDDQGATLYPVRDRGLRVLPVKGLREHRIEVEEYDSLLQRPRRDTFAVGPWQLVRAGMREATFGTTPLGRYRLSASVLSPVTIQHPKNAVVIEVRDTFPEMYLLHIRQKHFVNDIDRDGRKRVQFVLHGGLVSTPLSLPPGRYEVRYHTSAHCWSPWDTLVVEYGRQAFRNMSGRVCAPDPEGP